MDQWMLIAIIAAMVLAAASMVKSLFGLVLRYGLFVAFAAFITMRQHGEEDFGFISIDMAWDLAIAGGIAFVITIAVMFALFRKSRFGLLLYPLVGFATTFATVAVMAP